MTFTVALLPGSMPADAAHGPEMTVGDESSLLLG